MTVSNHFLVRAMEAMSQVTEVSYRRIFNGYGIYHQGIQFALVVNDHLYFRADDDSRSLYVAKQMMAFAPLALGAAESNFFQVPEEVLANPDELKYWMRIAVEAAQTGYIPGDDEAADASLIKHLKVR